MVYRFWGPVGRYVDRGIGSKNVTKRIILTGFSFQIYKISLEENKILSGPHLVCVNLTPLSAILV